jgi:hypothetical protein
MLALADNERALARHILRDLILENPTTRSLAAMAGCRAAVSDRLPGTRCISIQKTSKQDKLAGLKGEKIRIGGIYRTRKQRCGTALLA